MQTFRCSRAEVGNWPFADVGNVRFRTIHFGDTELGPMRTFEKAALRPDPGLTCPEQAVRYGRDLTHKPSAMHAGWSSSTSLRRRFGRSLGKI